MQQVLSSSSDPPSKVLDVKAALEFVVFAPPQYFAVMFLTDVEHYALSVPSNYVFDFQREYFSGEKFNEEM
jgi:hypothetical protein